MADGLHRSIERFRFESLNRRIRDDPPYQWTGLSVGRRRSRRDRPTLASGECED